MVKGGGHGDYKIIVLAPASAQELMDYTFLAFDLADKVDPAATEFNATPLGATGTIAADSEVLRNLLGRLDDALSEDGQLL